MKSKLSLSIMCADQFYLGEVLQEAKLSGAESIHADIMDGQRTSLQHFREALN